jgi:hypothetical protein
MASRVDVSVGDTERRGTFVGLGTTRPESVNGDEGGTFPTDRSI